jgi:hypothetical protein
MYLSNTFGAPQSILQYRTSHVFLHGLSSRSLNHVSSAGRTKRETSRVHVRRTERSRVKSSSLMPIVLVIKVKYMYHTEVSPNLTNGNADINESGALPFL